LYVPRHDTDDGRLILDEFLKQSYLLSMHMLLDKPDEV